MSFVFINKETGHVNRNVIAQIIADDENNPDYDRYYIKIIYKITPNECKTVWLEYGIKDLRDARLLELLGENK